MSREFVSSLDIGQAVFVGFRDGGPLLEGHVRAVTFSTSKVRYAVKVGDHTLLNIDSVCVGPRKAPPIEFSEDNFAP